MLYTRKHQTVTTKTFQTSKEGTSCFGKIEDIASQLISLEDNIEARFDGVDVDGFEVAMGGGRRHFIPKMLRLTWKSL